MSRSLFFIALFAPMMLFMAGALAAHREWWDAAFAAGLGLVSYITVVRDLRRTAAGVKEDGRG